MEQTQGLQPSTPPKNDFMHKLARQIVERRNLIFLVVAILLIFSMFSRNWVSVENDLTTYLPETSGTRQALDVMEEEFTTYGTADVMVANVTQDEAQALADRLTELEGVQSLTYDETTSHYNNASVPGWIRPGTKTLCPRSPLWAGLPIRPGRSSRRCSCCWTPRRTVSGGQNVQHLAPAGEWLEKAGDRHHGQLSDLHRGGHGGAGGTGPARLWLAAGAAVILGGGLIVWKKRRKAAPAKEERSET